MNAPVQVTVVEYVNEFFKNYFRRAYAKTLSANASKGAETLMGMLKLVLSRGGRDELRIALHCFKDQLMSAINSPATIRQQKEDEVFALMSSLIDAAERLRQFSPVKEQLSTAVLEEVRYRLYRIIVGDGFSEDVALRRRALDLAFTAMMREAAEQERSLARLSKLSGSAGAGNTAAGAGAAGNSLALVPAGGYAVAPGAAAGTESGAKGPRRLRASMQRKGSVLSGPDFSSWEGLWNSLSSMTSRRMLPLLQVAMTDLYMGKLMPGSPAAIAAIAASSSSGSNGPAVTPKGTNTPPKQVPQTVAQTTQAPQQQQQQQQRVAEQASLLQPERMQSCQESSSVPAPMQQQQQQPKQLDKEQLHDQQEQQVQAGSIAGPSPAVADVVPRAAAAAAAPLQQQQQPQQQQQGNASILAPAAAVGSTSVQPAAPVPATVPAATADATAAAGVTAAGVLPHGSSSSTKASPAGGLPPVNSSSNSSILGAQGTQGGLPPTSSSTAGTHTSSPRAAQGGTRGGSRGDVKGALASLASRLSGGGGSRVDKQQQQQQQQQSAAGSAASSPASAASSKWGGLTGGFLGLQSSSNGVVGSGRLIPRGWVQFGQQQQQQGSKGGSSSTAETVVSSPGTQSTEADAEAFAFGAAAADAGGAAEQHGQQQQPRQQTQGHADKVSGDKVCGAVEPETPGKGPVSGAAAAEALLQPSALKHSSSSDDAGPELAGAAAAAGGNGGADAVGVPGFECDEPDWESASSGSYCTAVANSQKPPAAAAVARYPAATGV